MITPEQIGQAKKAIMLLNHQVISCPHCGKTVQNGVVNGPLASILIEALESYGKDEVRPRISPQPENSNNKGTNRGRKGRQKKARVRS